MLRSVTITLLVAASTATTLPASAQTVAPMSRHVHKVKPAKPAARPSSSGSGINTPSADFSTVEPPDDGAASAKSDGGNVRPVIGAGGNIGLGTGF